SDPSRKAGSFRGRSYYFLLLVQSDVCLRLPLRHRQTLRLCDALIEPRLERLVERQAAVEIPLGFVLAALQQPRESAFRPGDGQLRVQLNGPAEVSLGALQIAFGFQERAAIEPGLSIARSQRNRPVVIGHRAVEISFLPPRRAALDPGLKKIGIEF